MKTSQEEYLARLSEIQDNIQIITAKLPADEPRFIIDSNTREITIPEDFTFLGVLSDTNAETFYFEIDRYFDQHDLNDHTCIVQIAVYDSNNNTLSEDIFPVTVIDVDSIEGKIIFGWTITSGATAHATNVSFSIRFYSLDENNRFSFSFNTLPATLPVLNSLNVQGNTPEQYPSLLIVWNQRMQELFEATSLRADESLESAESASKSASFAADSKVAAAASLAGVQTLASDVEDALQEVRTSKQTISDQVDTVSDYVTEAAGLIAAAGATGTNYGYVIGADPHSGMLSLFYFEPDENAENTIT